MMTSTEKLIPHCHKNKKPAILFSIALLIGIMVCLICDIAISGNLTWSLIPVSSIVFAWVISFPAIMFRKKGVIVSLISFSVFIIPYLFILSKILKMKEVFSVGAAISFASIIFLWIITAVFNIVGKTRKPAALGISFLLAIPYIFIINVILSKMIAEPIIDVWDILSVVMLLILAFVSFIFGHTKKRDL